MSIEAETPQKWNFSKGFLVGDDLLGSVNPQKIEGKLTGKWIAYVIHTETGKAVHYSVHDTEEFAQACLQEAMSTADYEAISECGQGGCAGCKANGTEKCVGIMCKNRG